MNTNSNSDLNNRRIRNVKRRSRFTALLTIFFTAVLMVPNLALVYTEHYSIWSNEVLIFLPLGVYLLLSVAMRRSGVIIWLLFPLIFLCAFQIVLLYLFGNSVIATDMFTNVLTTNPGEAGELLSNIYPSVILVVVLYVPVLWLAVREMVRHRYISHKARKIIAITGGVFTLMGSILLIPAYHVSEDKHVLRNEIFPVNVCYNIGVCASEFRKAMNFHETSATFKYEATRSNEAPEREIYVYIIGEASRAMNWELFGYDKPTNPQLKKVDHLVLFRDVLTQSNTTHKSVPMFLSSVSAATHAEIYTRRGLPQLFKEAGFETWFISNQSPQGAMIDHLAYDADHIFYVPSPRYDMQMLEQMQKDIAESKAQKMLFILHCYGSHFSYHQRYPQEFARFKPDDDVAISPQNIGMIRNAYDNSIVYTDHFLSQTIGYLNSLENTTSALLYCADHGEDLLDDDRGRFLHASPTTTAYQLYVASLAWFSENYRLNFSEKYQAAVGNSMSPATTHSMFHTMADMASIESPYLEKDVSLVHADFNKEAPRYYLNDHNEAVHYIKTGLEAEDLEVFRKLNIKP